MRNSPYMQKRGIKDPRNEPFTPGGRREGFKSNMAIGGMEGVEEVTCKECGEVFPAFQTKCPECKTVWGDQ